MHLFQVVTAWVIDLIRHFGYGGITLGMTLQAIGVPLPSEVMMSFGGYLAYTRELLLPGSHHRWHRRRYDRRCHRVHDRILRRQTSH